MELQKFLRNFVKRRLKEMNKNRKWLAHQAEVSDSGLSQTMNGYCDFKLITAEKILNAVGYKICVVKKTEWDN